MIHIEYENAARKRVNINENDIRLISLDGAGPIAAVNTAETPGFDGATLVGAQLPMRTITLVLDICGDVNAGRLLLYDLFRIKQLGTLYIDTGQRSAKIACVVEKAPFEISTDSMEMQISLLCPQPYWESLDTISAVLASIIPMWRFPFTIPAGGMMFSRKSDSVIVDVPNHSEVDVGMTVVFFANSALTNPSIMNLVTGEVLRLDTAMLAGDTITVTTHRGNKRITRTRGGVSDNLFNALSPGSVFLQLRQGDNPIRYNADSNLGGLELTIYHTDYYAGV